MRSILNNLLVRDWSCLLQMSYGLTCNKTQQKSTGNKTQMCAYRCTHLFYCLYTHEQEEAPVDEEEASVEQKEELEEAPVEQEEAPVEKEEAPVEKEEASVELEMVED